jgi:hypothetical protein
MKTLIGKVTNIEDQLQTQDLYFKGKITVKCPTCKSNLIADFKEDYMCDPVIGKKDFIAFPTCDKCEKDYQIPCVIKEVNIVIEYDDTKITEY